MNKLFLLDAMALIYRAHFAFSKAPRINSKGMSTGAVLGFTNTLLDLIKKEKPTHIGVAFDTAEPTFRHIEYKEYKAQRQAQPEDITVAIPYVYKMVEAFNIPILVKPGWEADDIIGTIAKKAARAGGFEIYMMTPDKDYSQLVEDNVFLYKPGFLGNEISIWGTKEVLQRWDIEKVDQVRDILGLQGDASDNIPGIPGIGEKTAIKMIKDFGSVEGLIANVEQLKGKQKESVEKYAEQALLSKKLATIDIDTPIDFDPKALEMEPMNEEAVKALFDELEFRTLKSRLFKEEGTAAKTGTSSKKTSKKDNDQLSLFEQNTKQEEDQPALDKDHQPYRTIASTVHHYYKVDTPELRKRLIDCLQKQEEFCLDTETTSLVAIDAQLVGLALSFYPTEAYYVPFPPDKSESQKIIDEFKQVLENPAIMKIGQNIKYDYTVLKNYGIELQGKLFDTMLAHYLVEPDMRHNMDVLAENYLHYSPVSIETLIGKKGDKQSNMRDVDTDKIVEYAGEDADVTLQLKHTFIPLLKSRQEFENKVSALRGEEKWNLERVFNEVETPLIPVLAEMESNGVKIDTGSLGEISQDLAKTILETEDVIYRMAGANFNIASPRQLGEILFDKLKLDDKAKKTKTGQYATGEEVLVRLSEKHEIVNKIIEYRELVKLKNTYVDALPSLVNAQTDRLHTTYQQSVAATGRLSSINPNLQNIPIRTEKGREIRKAFVPRNSDYILLSADYSQIELRLMAAFSGDETMIEAFKKGQDIHTITASKIYKIPLEQVDSDMRRKAKTANFGIIYGISAHGLSQRLNIPRREASDIITSYFEQFPGVKIYMDEAITEARKHEYVETILGRRRYLRNINSNNNVERGNAERNAINAPLQGSAADMIKLAMIRIHDFIRKNKLKSRMILQVHDELVFDAHKDELDILRSAVSNLMKNAIPLPVPMEVGMGTGDNWLQAH